MKLELKQDMSNLVDYLKESVGINVKLCEYFAGIRNNANKKYINIIFKDRLWASKEYDILSQYIAKYKTNFSYIEPNGVRRAALHIRNNKEV